MTKRILIAVTLAATGCVQHIPPVATPPRAGTKVSASFAKTWTAAVDAFADRNIGIRTIDRSSGLIVADPVAVNPEPSSRPHSLADCGAISAPGQVSYAQPTSAIYNVRVRGDSATNSSLVLVTVRYLNRSAPNAEALDCGSKGAWESSLEALIKAKAEGR